MKLKPQAQASGSANIFSLQFSMLYSSQRTVLTSENYEYRSCLSANT